MTLCEMLDKMRKLVGKVEEAIANDELEAVYSHLDQIEFTTSVVRRYYWKLEYQRLMSLKT